MPCEETLELTGYTVQEANKTTSINNRQRDKIDSTALLFGDNVCVPVRACVCECVCDFVGARACASAKLYKCVTSVKLENWK